MYLVLPCFDWIGFHLCEKLLQQGEQVIGIGEARTARQDNFWGFLARNSSFQLFSTMEEYQTGKTEAKLEAIIQIETVQKTPMLDAGNIPKKFFLSRVKQEKLQEEWCHVHLPLLYGEWMPRTEDSLTRPDGGTVPFNSESFLTDAVYIGDFFQEFLPLLEIKQPSKHIVMCPPGKEEDKREVDAEVIPVLPSEKPELRQKKLNQHYEKFMPFY
ncbi:hypothetical protein ERJ70_04815 [Sediminibacillus dalangtanensis]|uniref:Uncharacterized protein n=1 Tax=Sediminibacillus dalangtanensis TaxID=2729421 RepID=A0ABX7VRS0_9BACI|nr:hypothetical protein [Sediminibacillus dalangtanensis]QTM98679.1 hypothetical protein ERJ70_04815 [Sediminibacillus dalangtanensis]